jgi:hypothetical protein
MTVSERRMREALRNPPGGMSLPPRAVDEAIARGRRHGRWMAAGAIGLAAATATTVITAVVALTQTQRQPAGIADKKTTVVPWLNDPAVPPVSRALPCSASDLSLSVARGGAAAGTYGILFAIENGGNGPCTVSGYPAGLSGKSADGTWHNVSFQRGGSIYDWETQAAAMLAPGKAANFGISMPSQCGRQPTPAEQRFVSVRILLARGTLSTNARFSGACPINVSPVGLLRRTHLPIRYDGLTLAVDRPHSAPAGSTLTYTVTLTNGSRRTLHLRPCPVYAERVILDGSSGGTYRLNCDQASTIAAGGSVTYEMRLPMPQTPGLAKFSWQVSGSHLEAGGRIRVLPAATSVP